MGYYYFIATTLYLLGIVQILDDRRKVAKWLTIISAILLILFSGLKTDGSTDFLEYKNLFNSITSFNLDGFIEPGFQILIIGCHKIDANFIIFYFLVACISISLKSVTIYKITPYVGAAFLIYFCGCFFERDNDGIRQGLSLGFCFISLYYLSKDNNKQFFVFTLIACLIHYSSIFFFITYFLKKFHWNTKIVLIIIAVAYILALANSFLTQMLISNIPIQMVSTKLEIYSNNSNSEELGISIGIIFRTLLLILFMLNRKRIVINDDLYYILRNGLLFSIVCSLLFGDFIIIAHRLPYAFREFQIFIASFLISALQGKINKISGLTVVFIYTCIILNRFLTDGSAYINYNNLLFE